MIKVCPAILTNSLDAFKEQLNVYSENFDRVDIDINLPGDLFLGKETLTIEKIKNTLLESKNTTFGIHLMVDDPVDAMRSTSPEELGDKLYRVFVHQESTDESEIEQLKNYPLGVVLNPDDELRDLNYYNQFGEIQFMSVHPGYQGGKFVPYVLDTVLDLRSMGYEKDISIDGGVDLDTTGFIKEFPVDRVSVGSFFSRYLHEIPLRKMKLELSLNMKSEIDVNLL